MTSCTNRLYEDRALTCHNMYMSKGLDSGGEIAHGSNSKGGHSVDSVSHQENVHKNGEKNKDLLH